ncbi:MAG TPA: hypothetical protein VEC15_03820 [Actinomycetota bacterium]|nr:hypothetical protein [Actinomycetota bacterium]
MVELYADVIRVMKAPMYFQDDDVTSRDPVVGIDAAVEDVLDRLTTAGISRPCGATIALRAWRTH